jgi:HK97 family phage portal protein
MSDFTVREKLGLLTYYYVDKVRSSLRDLKLTDPKAWNPALWNLYGAGRSQAGIDVNQESGLNTSAVFNAITILSGTTACLPLHLYKKKSDGSRKQISKHPALSVLSSRPNPAMAAINYSETMMGHSLGWGNEFSEIVRDRTGNILELWPITPNRVKVLFDNWKKYFEITVGNEKIVLSQEKVLHIPGLGYDGLVGYSVITKARESIGLAMAAEEFGGRFFGHNTNLGGIIKYPRSLGPEAKKNLKDSLKENYSGLGNTHRWMILEDGVDIDKIGIPPDDSQFLQTRQFQVQDIARWFNMPPHMLKDLSRATFSNIEEQGLEFVKYTLNPWLIRREQNYNIQLLSEKERNLGYYFKYSVEGLLRGDSKSRAEFYKELFYLGAITPNEIRIKEDMEPVEGGDTPFVQMNMIRLEDAIKEPEPMPAINPQQSEPEPEENSLFWDRILTEDKRALNMIEDRSVLGRDRVASQYYRLFNDAAQRIMNKETKAIIANLKASANQAEFKRWLKNFYEKMPDYIRKQFGPTMHSFIDAIMIQAAKEVNESIDIDGTEEFKDGYLKGYIARHIERSFYQVNALEDTAEISDRMDDWHEKRASKIAVEETVRASSAAAQYVFFSTGFASIWRIRGSKTCPYCVQLSGKKVRQGETLLKDGDEFEPEGAKNGPMKIRGSVSHPPLHQGCDCYVSHR